MRLSVCLVLGCVVWSMGAPERATAQQPAGKGVPLSSLTLVSGEDLRGPIQVSVGTVKHADAYGLGAGGAEYALNKQFDWFIASFAADDTSPTGWSGEYYLDADGQRRQEVQFKVFEAPKPVRLRVTGCMRLAITTNAPVEDLRYGVIINPRLVAGDAPVTSPTAGPTSATTSGTGQAATFVVDPNDLDKLAVGLRKKIDAKPTLKQRVEKGEMALMTFKLVDIPSTSVADNVTEDLSTALINADLNLVERGQLDKVLKELKIQDVGLVNPKTAQKIGQLSGCNFILLGSISDRGQFVVINARLLETSTGKALAAERVEMRKIPISR